MAELEVQPGGRVDARLTFASAEPLHGASLSEEDLRAFVLDGIDVTADGTRCDPSYGGAAPTEGDGLVIDASYACPAGAAEIGVVLFYLSALPRGHREVVRIAGPPGSDAQVEGVLTGDHRALTLALPRSAEADAARSRKERRARQLVALSATFTVLMLALAIWRWRATRRR